MNGKRIAFKAVFSLLVLAGFTSTPTFTFSWGKQSTNVNQDEYNALLAQCRSMRDEIIRLANEEIKVMRQRAITIFEEQTAPMIRERINAMGGSLSPAPKQQVDRARAELENNLAIMSANITAQVSQRIVSSISTYLRSIGTPTALQLLSNILQANFVF
jgi:hypothetical protein